MTRSDIVGYGLVAVLVGGLGFGFYSLDRVNDEIAAEKRAELASEAAYPCYAMMMEVKQSQVKGVRMKAPMYRRWFMRDNVLTVGECAKLTEIREQDQITETKAVYQILNKAGVYLQ